VHLNPRDLSLR